MSGIVKNVAVGIDLGTCTSSVAVFERQQGGASRGKVPVVPANEDLAVSTQPEGQQQVEGEGEVANEQQATASQQSASNVHTDASVDLMKPRDLLDVLRIAPTAKGSYYQHLQRGTHGVVSAPP
jgi:molecular chaperone DnaK (HSP70)